METQIKDMDDRLKDVWKKDEVVPGFWHDG